MKCITCTAKMKGIKLVLKLVLKKFVYLLLTLRKINKFKTVAIVYKSSFGK